MEKRILRRVLQIDGMTCTSCEMKIENMLKNVNGIINAKANFTSSNVYVTYDESLVKINDIVSVIEKLDYKVLNKCDNENTINNQKVKSDLDKFSVNKLIGIGIILAALLIVTKNTIGFNFIPEVNQNMGYGILFVVGMLTSLHCVAMCGGINLSQCISYKYDHNSDEKYSKLRPSIMYNFGRVISYTIIGGIVGVLGSVFNFSGAAKGVVAIFAGIFMIIMGVNMLNIFPWLRKFNPRIPKIFGNKIHNNNGKYGPFYVGLLNGLMPCGPLQAMQLYALGTGSFITGALSMFMFSLGTVPLMFGFGAISSFLSSKFTKNMMKFSAALVVILGIIMLNRGLSLSGVSIAYASNSTSSVGISGNVAKIDGNVQVVSTSLESGRYTPIVVQKGVPVRWNIKANAKDINGCNGTLIIPKFGKEIKLKAGDNIIEFTPQEDGNVPYSCWMGMIRSNIKVVDDVNNVPNSDVQQSGSINAGSVGGGCCSVSR